MHASCAILVYHLGVDKDERATEKGLQGETARKSASFVLISPFLWHWKGNIIDYVLSDNQQIRNKFAACRDENVP